MATEDDPIEPTSGEEPSKKPLSLVLYLATDAFPYETEHIGAIQGRSLSGAMEKALLARLAPDDKRPDLDVSRTFMGCASGMADAPLKPVWNPLTPDQVAQLTDQDVSGFAAEFLTNVAKVALNEDPVAQLAAFARAERKRIAEDLDKHGGAVNESMRDIAANSSIMQNWSALQESIQGSAANFQLDMQRVMGPAARATDSLREAIEAIKRPTFDIDAILRSPVQRAIDAARAHELLLRSPIEQAMEALQAQEKRFLDPVQDALDAARAHDELLRSGQEKALEGVLNEFHEQIDLPGLSATEELRKSIDGLGRDYSPHLPVLRSPEIFFPKEPPFEKTATGRTALAVEALRDAGSRMEQSMSLVVGQTDKVAGLITGVTSTIQEQAKQIQSHSEEQTKKTMGIARWSLVVAAAALVVSAAFGIFGYWGDRADAHSQDARSQAMLDALLDQNAKLKALIEKPAAPPKPPSPPAMPQLPVKISTSPPAAAPKRD